MSSYKVGFIGGGNMARALVGGLALQPVGARGRGKWLAALAAGFRALPVPVIGRVRDDAYSLDMRCLADEAGFLAQLDRLEIAVNDDSAERGNGLC